MARAASTAAATAAGPRSVPTIALAAASAHNGRVGNIGQGNRCAGAVAAGNGKNDAGGCRCVVADLAFLLLVAVAVAIGRCRNGNRCQDLALVAGGEVGGLVELARLDLTHAAIAAQHVFGVE